MTSFTHHLTTLLAGISVLGLTGCVFDSDPLPEMPYHPRAVPPKKQPKQEEPVQTTTWEETAAPSPYITTSVPAPPKAPAKGPDAVPAAASVPRVTPTVSAVPTPPTAPAAPEPTPTPAPTATPAPVEQPVQPTVINLPSPAVENPPVAPSAPAASPAPATPSTPPATELKQITNTGPIPTAARVEGDPTRVWNPLDPSKKIRIINPKTNQPYPSGKKLKVRGTNFQFYVP